MTQQQPSNHIHEAKKMVPGDELHLALLMAPYSLNFFTGQDRQHLLAFGRAAFEAGQAAAQAEPFMWAIQEPGGGAYMDENCVSTSRGIVEAEVDGLNLGLDADDEPYKVVPVYLAAAQQAVQAAAPVSVEEVIKISEEIAYMVALTTAEAHRGANVSTKIERAQELKQKFIAAVTNLAATHPTQQGMDVIAGAIALCKHAAKIQNIDFDDYWAIHSDEFKEEAQLVLDAAQAKQGGA